MVVAFRAGHQFRILPAAKTRSSSADLRRIAEPAATELHQGAALEFFKVARSQSGYGPQALSFAQVGQQRRESGPSDAAVLWYVIWDGQGRALAEAMRRISGLGAAATRTPSFRLLSGVVG